jgi:hypothetical protein
VGTAGTDCKNLIAPARKKHGFLAHVANEHASIRDFLNRQATRQIGSGWLGWS